MTMMNIRVSRRAAISTGFAFLACSALSLANLRAQPPAGFSQPRRFQSDIERMLERDKTNPPPHDAILFIGSSIFRFWTQLTEQMAPLPVFNRAFGGSVTQDLLDRMDQLVFPYHPRIIVYYCGSNDVSAGESADAILQRTKQFLKIVSQRAPDTFVYYTAIQKAPEKRRRWNVVDAVNREMERYSHETRNLAYIDLNPVLFDHQGNLREDLFLPDGLHFRPESTAYAEFGQVVKPILNKAWESGVGSPKSHSESSR
jgi:lysophospholipase L1-like esterase